MASEAELRARHAVIDAARRAMNAAADFTCSAGNFDRPISETPWLARNFNDGDPKYDARWYAVRQTQTHFNEQVSQFLNDALATYAAIVLIEAGHEPA